MTYYENSGVHPNQAEKLIREQLPAIHKTFNPHVLTDIGGFCSLYQINDSTIIAASTDGVGSKTKLTQRYPEYYLTIGIDLVAMIVNDIITCGAEPLFLLDYYGLSNLNNTFEESSKILRGITLGCKMAGIALIGGETSEMPSIYKDKDYDLVGFGVGRVNNETLIGPLHVQRGDDIIGIESTGPHSNGFSIINQLVNDDSNTIEKDIRQIMTPTAIYSSLIRHLLSRKEHGIHAMAHITGGGIKLNTSRVIPCPFITEIQENDILISMPYIFQQIKNITGMRDDEFLEVFNCGIGYTIVCDPTKTHELMRQIESFSVKVKKIGKVY